jgi:hypothetical protein
MFADQTFNLPKTATCPVNKMMKKINDDYKDSTRLKLKEKDIFEGATALKSVQGEKKGKKQKR